MRSERLKQMERLEQTCSEIFWERGVNEARTGAYDQTVGLILTKMMFAALEAGEPTSTALFLYEKFIHKYPMGLPPHDESQREKA